MLIGTYEKRRRAVVAERDTPWDFAHELLPPDLDRIAPASKWASSVFRARAGRDQEIVNGPFTFAPDGNPLIGPVRGMSNYWVACGVMAGFSQGGGVGIALANWMIDGEPASTCGRWTLRASATGRPWPTRTPRFARTIRAASASASRTRNCRRRGRCG